MIVICEKIISRFFTIIHDNSRLRNIVSTYGLNIQSDCQYCFQVIAK